MSTSEIKIDENSPSSAAEPVPAPPAQLSTIQKLVAMVRVIVQLPKIALSIIENQGKMAQAISTNATVLNQLSARVHWYENRVPFIKKEYFAFKEAEENAMRRTKAALEYEERERRRAEMKSEMAVVQ